MKIEVITYNCIVGYHCWREAPQKVDFLRHKHRHNFHIRCYLSVEGLDREREIFLEEERLKRFIYFKYGEEPCDFGESSCETLANEILNEMNANSVEVLEDGLGGAKVTKES